MNLNTSLNQVLEQLLIQKNTAISNEQLIHCLDLTLLTKGASTASLVALDEQANKHQVAAICVLQEQLTLFQEKQSKLATVINFPHGTDTIEQCILDIERAQKDGAQEIDYVLPYQNYLSGKQQQALKHAAQVIRYCQERQLTVKVIIESGAFAQQELLYQVSRQLIDLGVEFLKTSTGTIEQGASYNAAFVLLTAIKEADNNCGIKISGGIKTPEQAHNYARLAQLMLNKPLNKRYFRIGASTLLQKLL